MNANAGILLLIAVAGLVAVCRGGTWHWDPIGQGGPACLQTRFFHRLLLGMFWTGWSTSLVLGLLRLLK
jgi:hypothetical protein